ncbi:tripartite tricarboxylate transporter permease [Petroclostridium sp. X23]|uniref:tripartite tricarboxylate transporter permease n=1 Tax=Petroclostridium sp. X23 TaxID=3045146 RepID=UPI0024ACE46C|nr:tripartite tricarboxylate transporter permease [Petroclostridium sp. X23]WHH60357.1 tripartite tricarboxylate transporter permease [Petroclostridium sp. X23]
MENILLGLTHVFQPYNLLICTAGLFIGVLFGALPGFSATMGVAVFVPFSYVMEPEAALLLLSSIYCGGVYGGSIPAILLGIPGTPASAPTSFDGHALTLKGESGRSLVLSTFGSTIGGFLSAIALLLFSPLLAKIAIMVGPPEQVMIAIFGLSVVCMLSFGNMLRGVLVGFLSLLIATIGQDPVLGFPRFTAGIYQLTGGLAVVPVLIGIFSLPEVLKMLEEPAGKLVEASKVSKMTLKISDISGNIINFIRSTLIGIGIGIIPAAGPDIASFLSYNEAKKASKKPEEFGRGSIEGIIAAETANNGVTGGSLIPLLTLGIPGSAPAAIFLGAMIIHGLRPGPMLFTENAAVVYTLLIGFAVINVLMFFVGFLYCKWAGKILLIPKSVLATVIVVLATVGSFSINQNMFDVLVMFLSGVIGYIMVKNDYPVSPVTLALLLGPMLEESLTLVSTMYSGNYMRMFFRPLTSIFFAFTLFSFVFPFIKNMMDEKKREKVQ